MTAFWIIAAVLVVVAVAAPLWSLLHRRGEPDVSQSLLNTAIYRDRLEELKRDLAEGVLEAGQFEAARAELARALLQDLEGEAAVSRAPRRGWLQWWPAAAVVLLVAGAVALYGHLRQEIVFADVPPAVQSEEAQRARQEAQRLLRQIQAEPARGETWLLLGQKYMKMERPDAALQAYDRAQRLMGENPDLLVHRANALGRLHGGDLEGEPARLIARALELDPDHRAARIWWGLVALQRGDAAAAEAAFTRARDSLPPDAPRRALLDRLIDQARGAGAAPGTGEAARPPAPATQGAAVTVTARLDPALAGTVPPGATVFILARAADGPPMPLAVVRRQARDLPVTVTLDDSLAMMPQMRLSRFDQVRIIARVSLSGDAMPRPGDLQGEAGPLDPRGGARAEVVIDRTLP